MLIASRMATLNATMNKKNFPTVMPSREPNVPAAEWFVAQVSYVRLGVPT
jgi:hypothetical protein